MPKHKIEIRQPGKRVLNSDIAFTVYSDGTKLGELQISKGSIDWKPANKRASIQRTWEWFAETMEG